MKISQLVLFALLLTPSCIEFLADDDYSRELTASNRKSIAAFNLNDTGKEHPVSKAEDITFQETDAEKLKSQLGLNKKTWVYIWGPWCSPCRKKLPTIAQIHRDHPDINILLVSDNYNLPEIKKLLYENALFFQTYLLDYRRYGNKIYEKERKLWDELALGGVYPEGVPQNYLFNEKGQLFYSVSGPIPDETMQAFFGLK